MSRYFKIHTFISIITSLILSRAVFYFIDDPEGPNLLIVVVLAVVIFLLTYILKYAIMKVVILIREVFFSPKDQ